MTDAPAPMPYWRSSIGPSQRLSASIPQPSWMTRKPWARIQATPSAPQRISRRAAAGVSCRRPSKRSGNARGTATGSSQKRPWSSACCRPGAAPCRFQASSQAGSRRPPETAYQGRSAKPAQPMASHRPSVLRSFLAGALASGATVKVGKRPSLRPIRPRQFGRLPTSLSQRSSSLARVSDEPNSLKS